MTTTSDPLVRPRARMPAVVGAILEVAPTENGLGRYASVYYAPFNLRPLCKRWAQEPRVHLLHSDLFREIA